MAAGSGAVSSVGARRQPGCPPGEVVRGRERAPRGPSPGRVPASARWTRGGAVYRPPSDPRRRPRTPPPPRAGWTAAGAVDQDHGQAEVAGQRRAGRRSRRRRCPAHHDGLCAQRGERISPPLESVRAWRRDANASTRHTRLARQLDQHREPGRALDPSADRRALRTDEQVTSRVRRNETIGDLGRPPADQRLRCDMRPRPLSRRRPRDAQSPPRTQHRPPARVWAHQADVSRPYLGAGRPAIRLCSAWARRLSSSACCL